MGDIEKNLQLAVKRAQVDLYLWFAILGMQFGIGLVAALEGEFAVVNWCLAVFSIVMLVMHFRNKKSLTERLDTWVRAGF